MRAGDECEEAHMATHTKLWYLQHFRLLDALTVTSARVLVLEYNALFGPERAVTIPNAPRPQGVMCSTFE